MLSSQQRRSLGRSRRVFCVLLVVGAILAAYLDPGAAFAADSGCEASTPNAGDVSTAPDPEAESETIDEAMEGPTTITGEELAAKRAEFNNVTRPTFWKNEAANNPGAYSAADLARMQNGQAPIGIDGYPMELHHIIPLSQGGSNDPSNLRAMTRTAHRLGKNFRLNHPLQGCPDPEPKTQTTTGTANSSSKAQEDPQGASTHTMCFGDGTACVPNTIPRGAGTITFYFTHVYATAGTYTQRATITEIGTFSETTTTRVQTC